MYKRQEYSKDESRSKGTQTLEQYSRDLTAMATEGRLDPVIGREEEILRVIQVLSLSLIHIYRMYSLNMLRVQKQKVSK